MNKMVNGEVVPMTAEEIVAFEASRAAIAPKQVPMHKVRKAARLTPWPGSDHLLAAIIAAIAELPAPSDALAAIEFEYAPNLVREGATTLAVMAILGMTETQRDELLTFAASLP